jgi:hypothetical protein
VTKVVTLITNMDDKRSKYTNEFYMKAVKAREVQVTFVRPCTKYFLRVISDKLLDNCPITKSGIMVAGHFWV